MWTLQESFFLGGHVWPDIIASTVLCYVAWMELPVAWSSITLASRGTIATMAATTKSCMLNDNSKREVVTGKPFHPGLLPLQ